MCEEEDRVSKPSSGLSQTLRKGGDRRMVLLVQSSFRCGIFLFVHESKGSEGSKSGLQSVDMDVFAVMSYGMQCHILSRCRVVGCFRGSYHSFETDERSRDPRQFHVVMHAVSGELVPPHHHLCPHVRPYCGGQKAIAWAYVADHTNPKIKESLRSLGSEDEQRCCFQERPVVFRKHIPFL